MIRFGLLVCLASLSACASQLPDGVVEVPEPEVIEFKGNLAEFLPVGTDVSEVQRYLGAPLEISKLSESTRGIYDADEVRMYDDPNRKGNEYQITFLDGKLVKIWKIILG